MGSEPPVPALSVGRGRPGLAVGCRGCGGRRGCGGMVPSGRERWVSASSQPQEPARSHHSSSSVHLTSNKCIKASGIPLASLFSSFPRGAAGGGWGHRLWPWHYPCVPRREQAVGMAAQLCTGSWHCQGCRSSCTPPSPSGTQPDPDPEAEGKGSHWHRTPPSHNLQPPVPRSTAPSGGEHPALASRHRGVRGQVLF